MLAAARAAAAGLTGITGLSLTDGAADSDLMVVLTGAAGLPAGAAGQLAVAFAERLMARLSGRLRRGVAVAVDMEAADLEAQRPRGQD